MSDQNSISDFLENIKEGIDTPADVESVIANGMSNMKSKISNIDIQVESKLKEPSLPKEKPDVGPKLADRAINTYKTKINPPTGVEAGEVEVSQPVTKASREILKATIKALSGGRSSGDVGKSSETLPSGSGNVGSNDNPPVGLIATSVTMEEYRDQVWGSFGLIQNEEVESISEENEEEVIEENDLVDVLESALLDSDSRDWMSVDYIARQICTESKITLKELNRSFRDRHGVYPDKWIKEQVEVTQCGWMPLDEATRVNKVGLVYEVSFMHRGHIQRFKFFWPAMTRPSREEMQKSIEGFYPKARVLAFYPAVKQDDNFMVIVPPVSENVEVLTWDYWEELNEEANLSYHLIAEEIGEPVSAIYENENGYSVVVEDHDTGEKFEVTFSEDWQKTNRKDKTDGMSGKAVKQYRRENPGSKLKTAVTTSPSKLDPDSKDAKRRKNFCSRSRGWTGERGKAARARWNC